MSIETQEIKISGEPTSDPYVCRFTVDRSVSPDAVVRCTDPSKAAGSALLEGLFAIDGISEVLIYDNVLSVVKTNDDPWTVLGKQIGAAIRNSLTNGQTAISDDVKKRSPLDKQLRKDVQELLQKEINPYVSSHGGHIEVVDAFDNTVYVSMSGGCQGCASATATLRQGVEQIIFTNIPSVRRVIDVTDHASGTNPYYQ